MIFYNMIDYEYFDSVDETEENKKDVLTTNDNSNIMDKIHATITKTFTLLPSLKTIIIITLVVVLIFMFAVYYVDSEEKNANSGNLNKRNKVSNDYIPKKGISKGLAERMSLDDDYIPKKVKNTGFYERMSLDDDYIPKKGISKGLAERMSLSNY